MKRWQNCAALRTAIMMMTLVVVAGCRPSIDNFGFPPGAMVLRLASNDDVPTLDPAVGYDTASWTFEQAIFDTLVRYGDDDVELHPAVATSWESSPDATVFTFHLRNDVRFTNGRPVTAADFKYGIERVSDPATLSKGMEYYQEIAGAAEFAAHRKPHVDGIETPDPYTIIFRLTGPDPIFPHKLAMPFASAVPREVVEKWGEDFSRHVVGSGAFKLREWIGGQRIVLEKNHDYWVKGEPRLDGVAEQVGVNGELQWLKFESSEIDVHDAIPPSEFPYVIKTPALRALTLNKSTVTTSYLGMNCRMPPFDDVRVRQAFNYGINKEKLIAVINGRGVAARGVLPPNLPGYDPDVRGYNYDPAKARALLEQAHFPHDLKPVLWFRADQTGEMLAESVQQDLALVGVSVRLKPVAWGPLLEAIRQPKNVQLFMNGWEADFPDPENFLSVLLSRKQFGSNNDTFYTNPEVDKLLDQAALMTDFKKRYALYDQAQRIVIADAPWVFLLHPVNYVIRKPWVHDYIMNPMRPTRFERIWVSKH
jgi:peptide/nickel transport system substrate-binding protein/oligopeptide transport system substrate-binding protein